MYSGTVSGRKNRICEQNISAAQRPGYRAERTCPTEKCLSKSVGHPVLPLLSEQSRGQRHLIITDLPVSSCLKLTAMVK